MNYLDVYYSRLNHTGETTGERIRNGGIRSFERWMDESPFTVRSLSVERGLYFSGIIQTNKDKDYQKIMFLYVALDIPIKVGDVMNWQVEDGTIEKWLILSKEKKTNPTYQTFSIIKCNYLIKWINAKGYLRQSWSYVLSSTDDKVKGNFRTWHNLITPQPNKYAEIIMPRPVDENSQVIHTVDRGTNFIIEDEGWKMVEADFTSVEGIIYMSLTESKVNFQYDDLNVDIADIDKLLFPTLDPIYNVGEEIIPHFTEQTLNEWEVVLVPPEKKDGEPVYVDFDEQTGKLKALLPGKVVIKMRLKNYDAEDPRKAVTKEFEITINESVSDAPLYICGPTKLRLDRQEGYYLLEEGMEEKQENALAITSMVIQEDPSAKKPPSDYGTLTKNLENNKIYILHANNKNKLGKLVLVAKYNGIEYTKTVEIIPLW